MLIEDVPGSGKTTLARAVVERSRQRGAMAGVGHCVDVSGALPFGPVLEAACDAYFVDDREAPASYA